MSLRDSGHHRFARLRNTDQFPVVARLQELVGVKDAGREEATNVFISDVLSFLTVQQPAGSPSLAHERERAWYTAAFLLPTAAPQGGRSIAAESQRSPAPEREAVNIPPTPVFENVAFTRRHSSRRRDSPVVIVSPISS